MEDEDWFELFDYIDRLFSARGLETMLSVDEENYRDMVIETMRLLYVDLRNTNRSTAEQALQLISESVVGEVHTDHFIIGAYGDEEPSEFDRLVNTVELPDNRDLQEQIRKFVRDLGGPDFGNDPGGGFDPGGGPTPFGGFVWRPKRSKDRDMSEEYTEDRQASLSDEDVSIENNPVVFKI